MWGGVRRVSRWCLIDPGYCQDCIDGIPDGKKMISLYSTTAFPEIPANALHNANSGVVWKVSERCLEGVWRLLG